MQFRSSVCAFASLRELPSPQLRSLIIESCGSSPQLGANRSKRLHSGEHRPLACSIRPLGRIPCNATRDYGASCSRQAAANYRLAACAPRERNRGPPHESGLLSICRKWRSYCSAKRSSFCASSGGTCATIKASLPSYFNSST